MGSHAANCVRRAKALSETEPMRVSSIVRRGRTAALAGAALFAVAVAEPARAFDGCDCAGPVYPAQPAHPAGEYGCGSVSGCGGGFGFGAAGTEGGLGLGGFGLGGIGSGGIGGYGGVTYAPLGRYGGEGYGEGYAGGYGGYGARDGYVGGRGFVGGLRHRTGFRPRDAAERSFGYGLRRYGPQSHHRFRALR